VTRVWEPRTTWANNLNSPNPRPRVGNSDDPRELGIRGPSSNLRLLGHVQVEKKFLKRTFRAVRPLWIKWIVIHS